MVALERINVREAVGRKNNCKLNFFSMYFVRNNEEIHLSFKNSEKWRTQAVSLKYEFVSSASIIQDSRLSSNNSIDFMKSLPYPCFLRWVIKRMT